MDDTIERFMAPTRVYDRVTALGTPSPIPAVGGVYGWWFRDLPTPMDTSGCLKRDGLTLLYVGISPKAPPANGREASRQTLRTRIRTHYTGNAEGSTLRRTLGCLLADRLGIELRRVGSGSRLTFIDGEPVLSRWMAANALVSWEACDRPWEVEDALIASLDLPLNLEGNSRHAFHPNLTRIRADAVRRAKQAPIVANPGVAGRYVETPSGSSPFLGDVVWEGCAPVAPLARLVLTRGAATADRGSAEMARSLLVAALDALEARSLRAGILVTPAGFLEHRMSGAWDARTGWSTSQEKFDELASVAGRAASDLLTPELRRRAAATIDHLVLGVDLWPTPAAEPHAEVACLYDVGTDTVRAVTGKSYPTPAQEGDLIRQPDLASHLVQIGDARVAIIVCHDLAAWSPRGNAVARGTRAETWQEMQAAAAAAGPTLAVQLPHTVDNARMWRSAWSLFARTVGPSLRSGTTAIRHLDHGYDAIDTPVDAALLAGTGIGDRIIDIIISDMSDTEDMMTQDTPATDAPRAASSARTERTVTFEGGVGLARLALDVFRPRAAAYPDGIHVAELLHELELAGHPVHGDEPMVKLRSALNASQAHGVWLRKDGGLWVVGDGRSKMNAGISGRALAEALYRFVGQSDRYAGGVFHYEEARVGLEQTGVLVKGTGNVTSKALTRATDLFEKVPGRPGYWRRK